MKPVRLPILIAILVFGLATLACSAGSILATATPLPSATPYPTYTPYPTATPLPSPTPIPPTPTPPMSEVVNVLLANGFVQNGKNDCKSPCTDYFHSGTGVLVVVYDDGMVVYAMPIDKATATAVGGLIDKIFLQLYGNGVDAWAGTHIPDTINGPQTGTVDGYQLYMELNRDTNPPIGSIVITK